MADEKKKQQPKNPQPESRGERTMGGGVSYEKGSAEKQDTGQPTTPGSTPERSDVEGKSEGVESSPIATRCPNCGADLSSERGDLDRCPKCGSDLRRNES